MKDGTHKAEFESEKRQADEDEDEIDLIDLFLVLWKRKWLIVIVTVLLTVLAAGVSFMLPQIYAVTAILEPGKDADGRLVDNPQAIRENILGGAYNQVIAASLRSQTGDIPEFDVKVPKSTDLVIVTLETSTPERGVKILEILLDEISGYLQTRLEIRIDQTKNRIKAVELAGQTLDEQLSLLTAQLQRIERQMMTLEEGRQQALADPGDKAMAVLLYSNEIQNQQIYFNDLQMQLTELRNKKRENELDVEDARLRLAGIKGTNINKLPSAPEKPIKPRKTMIVVLAFVLGLMGGVMLAFIAEFMVKVRRQMTMETDVQT